MGATTSIVESGANPDLFLMQAVRHGQQNGVLSPLRVQELFGELTTFASVVMDGLVLRSSSAEARREAVAVAMQRVSIALEEEAQGRLDRASDVIARSALPHLLHGGNAIHARMLRRLESVREGLTVASALPTALSVLDEIDLANALEHVFLDRLAEGRLVVDEALPRLERLGRPRRMASLADYGLAGEMLARFSARQAVFDLLPPERLFAQTYPVDELGDTARIVICRLLVCVAERDPLEPAFDPTPVEVDSFRARWDDPERAGELGAWIRRFSSGVSPESREYAASYLEACRASLGTALKWLAD